MSSPTVGELAELSASVQGFVPEAEARRPTTFLSLAPTTSASYPTQRKAPAASPAKPLTSSPKIEATAVVTAPEPAQGADKAAASLVKHRRSSSLTSESSTGSAGKPRFLKLGPVHWGEDDGTGDWSEVGVTE
jgi:hypothetical protein